MACLTEKLFFLCHTSKKRKLVISNDVVHHDMSDSHLIIFIYCRNIELVSSEGLVIGAAQGDAGQANLVFAAISSA